MNPARRGPGPPAVFGYRAARLYDRVAGPVWERLVAGDAMRIMRREVRRLLSPGGEVLDIGAGTGRSTRLILREGTPGRVVAIDASAQMLARSHAVLGDRVELVLGSAYALPFADETFDLVVSLWMLETLDDPLAALGEALRVLRPNGAVLTAFSARPSARRATPALIESLMRPGFAGRFLAEQERPLHTCTKHCAHRWNHGLTTVATFGKACQAPALVPELVGARRP